MSLTISELAKILNLSTATVSKALNNYDEIPLKTKERVLSAARQYDYQPNMVARNLRLKQTGRIGLINPTSTLSDDYFIRILKGITAEAETKGYSLMLYTSFRENPETLTRACYSNEVDGLLVMGGGSVDHIIPRIIESKMPFILVGRRSNLNCVSFISPDDEQGVYLAVSHLIQAGHKQIAYIGQIDDPVTNTSRLNGYNKAMNEAGYDNRKDWLVSAPRHPSGGAIAMEEILSTRPTPSAAFCYSDGIAIEALQLLSERRIRIPEDMALVSCDNIYLSQSAQPPLTTIDIPLERIGKLAIQYLLEKIQNRDSAIIREYITGNLIIRKSSIQ